MNFITHNPIFLNHQPAMRDENKMTEGGFQNHGAHKHIACTAKNEHTRFLNHPSQITELRNAQYNKRYKKTSHIWKAYPRAS